jgi:hypothetical protein
LQLSFGVRPPQELSFSMLNSIGAGLGVFAPALVGAILSTTVAVFLGAPTRRGSMRAGALGAATASLCFGVMGFLLIGGFSIAGLATFAAWVVASALVGTAIGFGAAKLLRLPHKSAASSGTA